MALTKQAVEHLYAEMSEQAKRETRAILFRVSPTMEACAFADGSIHPPLDVAIRAVPAPPTLKPGIYRLSRDVTNPSPDRRYKHDPMMQPVWKAGLRFRLEAYENSDADIRKAECLSSNGGAISHYGEGWWDFLAALEPEPPSVRGLFEERYCGRLASASVFWPVGVIDRLVSMGKLTLTDVELALHEKDDVRTQSSLFNAG